MEVSLMRQPRAIAASTANSTALRFSTGKAPGRPRHTGQTLVFGGLPNRVEQEQKIFDTVKSWTCTSRPITGSYLARAATEASDVVAISGNYKRCRAQQHAVSSILKARLNISPTELRNTSTRSLCHRAHQLSRSWRPQAVSKFPTHQRT